MRAQITMEFLAMLVVVLLLILSLLVATQTRRIETRALACQIDADQGLRSITQAALRITIIGPGASESVYLPEYLDEELQYQMNMDNTTNVLETTFDGGYVSVPAVWLDFSGTIPSGSVTVTNSDGEVTT